MLRRVVCGGVARRAGLSTCANLAKASKSAAPQLTVEEILRALPPEAASEAREAPVVRPHALDDRFGRRHTYLRVSLTERCNLRCQYCMPEEGVALSADSALLTTSEVARLVSLFVRAGVSKVRFTGGEPTVRRDLVDVVRGANELRREGLRSIAMTTNGVVLAPRLPALLDAGLDALNVSLDTLDPRKFELITRRRGHERVLQAIRQAVACGRLGSRVKVNAVVVRGINDGEVADFVEWTRHEAVEVRFIEYMPFDGNRWDKSKLVSYVEMVDRIRTRFGDAFRRLEDGPNDTAKTWGVEGFAGRVGFISSMTDHFCFSCNRVRLTADGSLKVCLFGPNEVSLRDAMRQGCSDAELLRVVSAALQRKKAKHAGMFELAATKNRPMITIGG